MLKRTMVLLVMGLLLGACEDSGSTPLEPDGAIDGGMADTGAGDTGARDTGAGDTGAADTGSDGASGNSIEVSYGGQAKQAMLAKETPVSCGSGTCARLSDLVKQVFPALDQTKVVANFRSSDGFDPGMKSNCKGFVPVPGAALGKGLVDTVTHKLLWDSSLGYPGCLQVKDLARVLLADK